MASNTREQNSDNDYFDDDDDDDDDNWWLCLIGANVNGNQKEILWLLSAVYNCNNSFSIRSWFIFFHLIVYLFVFDIYGPI